MLLFVRLQWIQFNINSCVSVSYICLFIIKQMFPIYADDHAQYNSKTIYSIRRVELRAYILHILVVFYQAVTRSTPANTVP